MYRRTKTRHSLYRVATAPFRILPHFIILGSQRGGTTSLYRFLEQHPCMASSTRKECHYFDFNYARGLNWYRAYFPARWKVRRVLRESGRRLITGEASPYYLFHPHAPRRAAATVPGAKLIAILRNPVDRAYSHHQLMKKHGLEERSFEEAIDGETERIAPELAKMLADDTYYSYAHQNFSYLARGVYVDQLANWHAHFPREQLLVIRAEDLFKKPREVLPQVLEHVGLPPHDVEEFKRYHNAGYDPMDAATRQRLVAYFAPHNQRLTQYLGRDMNWQ